MDRSPSVRAVVREGRAEPMRATIKDIAKAAGVSIATVSNYLNGRSIKEENVRKIEKSIAEFHYVPNRAARNMRARRKRTIGVFLPKVGDYFWGNLYEGIEGYFRQRDYMTLILAVEHDGRLNEESKSLILSQQIDGGIIIAEKSDVSGLPDLLQSHNIPFVCADQPLASKEVDLVSSDNYMGAYRAAEYLIYKGHRRLGVLGSVYKDLITMQERKQGFYTACRAHGIPEKDIFVLSEREGENMGLERCLSEPTRPTALLSCGYDITQRAILKIRQLGYEIPEDISLISFDDDEMFTAIYPPISVVKQSVTMMGERSAELLLRRIEGDWTDFPLSLRLETKFIERESVKAAGDVEA